MEIDWGYWLSAYGLWAVLIGTFLEGESILVAGAMAAHHGYMDIRLVLLAALVGSFFGDQLYFFLGRIYGRRFLLRHPKLQHRVAQVHRLLDRYHAIFILGFRFLYGLRTVAPFVLGTSSVAAKRFVPLNFMGAVLWSLTVGGIGYALGEIDLSALWRGENAGPLALVAGGLALGLVSLMVLRRRRARTPDA
jgi:membrane protein DedA with SNARE-associated domain